MAPWSGRPCLVCGEAAPGAWRSRGCGLRRKKEMFGENVSFRVTNQNGGIMKIRTFTLFLALLAAWLPLAATDYAKGFAAFRQTRPSPTSRAPSSSS